MHENPLLKIIEYFSKLPGIGPKTAQRLALHLLIFSEHDLRSLAENILQLKKSIVRCTLCNNYTDTNPCNICSNTKRDQTTLCIVMKHQDLMSLEKTKEYNGLYYIFNTKASIKDENMYSENVASLLERIKNNTLKEIIIATNLDIEGESISIFLQKKLQPFAHQITRLARGLPMGADIEYADEVTLSNALKGRKKF